MKFRCEGETLVEALSTASRAVSARATMPVLSGLYLEAAGNQLRVTGTDLDLRVQVEIPVVVTGEGSCVVPARLLTDIVKSVSLGSITIEGDDEEVRISARRSQFVVRTLDKEEFPRASPSSEFTATLTSSDLSEALRQVVRAASGDDARPVLTGVLLSAHEDGLRLVATDSYRLAVRDVSGARVLASDQSVLVPSKALGELSRLLSGDVEVRVALDEREITFLVGDTTVTSRLIEGQFPDYRPLIPSGYPNRLRVDRDIFLEAVRRVKLLVRDTTTPVRLALRPDGVDLTVISQEIGQASEDVEAKYEGEAITVAFNPGYLINGLEAMSPGDVLLETIDALKPATLKAEEKNDYLYLIMPVRVS